MAPGGPLHPLLLSVIMKPILSCASSKTLWMAGVQSEVSQKNVCRKTFYGQSCSPMNDGPL